MGDIKLSFDNNDISSNLSMNGVVLYQNAKQILEVYSKTIWRLQNTTIDFDFQDIVKVSESMCKIVNNLIKVYSQFDRTLFDSKIRNIEESRLLIILLEKAFDRLKSYPEKGHFYYMLLKKIYIKDGRFKLSERDLLDELNLSRSTFYREKKKAIILFGLILWDYVVPDIYLTSK